MQSFLKNTSLIIKLEMLCYRPFLHEWLNWVRHRVSMDVEEEVSDTRRERATH